MICFIYNKKYKNKKNLGFGGVTK